MRRPREQSMRSKRSVSNARVALNLPRARQCGVSDAPGAAFCLCTCGTSTTPVPLKGVLRSVGSEAVALDGCLPGCGSGPLGVQPVRIFVSMAEYTFSWSV